MTTDTADTEDVRDEKLRVVIVGGGVAAIETSLALHELAPDYTDVTVIAPNPEFVYRPMTVREPFAYPFNPVIHGMLLTDGKPAYLTAHIAGGHGFSSEITDTPTWSPASKIVAKYLAPYLDTLDRESTRT